MRIKKGFVIVFLLTFFVGIISCFLLLKKENLEKKDTVEVTLPKTSELKSETVYLPEILEENKDWEKDEESILKVKLLETGEGFHGDEIKAKTGEIWLGFFKKRDKFFLENRKLKITRVHDEIVDDKKSEKTGKSVNVLNENQSIFLLKNADYLKEGEIKTLFGGNPNQNEVEENIDYLSLRIGFIREFKIGDETYILQVKKGLNKKGEKIIALVLENKNAEQTLHSSENFGDDDYLGTLYWAGDLDGDRKPDFYFSLYIQENTEYKCLFLSSKAKKNELVKKVAVFSTTGC